MTAVLLLILYMSEIHEIQMFQNYQIAWVSQDCSIAVPRETSLWDNSDSYPVGTKRSFCGGKVARE